MIQGQVSRLRVDQCPIGLNWTFGAIGHWCSIGFYQSSVGLQENIKPFCQIFELKEYDVRLLNWSPTRLRRTRMINSDSVRWNPVRFIRLHQSLSTVVIFVNCLNFQSSTDSNGLHLCYSGVWCMTETFDSLSSTIWQKGPTLYFSESVDSLSDTIGVRRNSDRDRSDSDGPKVSQTSGLRWVPTDSSFLSDSKLSVTRSLFSIIHQLIWCSMISRAFSKKYKYEQKHLDKITFETFARWQK